MMELAHSLCLNEEALQKLPEAKRPVFVFEWLRFLDKVLTAAQKSDIKESQPKLIQQLTELINSGAPGPPTRKILARCLATLFSVGDTFLLFDTINKCNDVIKNKDDSPSYLPTRLAAVCVIGAMYEKLGRMVGRSYEETVQLMIKALKNAESQGRCEIMLTFQKMISGLGSAAANCHKDIYKAAKQCMTDRAMSVRCAAAKCMLELVHEWAFLYTTELDSMASLCYRSLDGSNYDVRCAVAKLLGRLLAKTQTHKPAHAKAKPVRIDEIFGILATGFIKGGSSGMRSTAGEMIKGTVTINREIRVGITHAYVEFVRCMGNLWLERNIGMFLTNVLNLVSSPRATPTHVDAVYARKCIVFIMSSVIGSMLGEKAQISAAKEICQIISQQMNTMGAETVIDGADSASVSVSSSQHVVVTALHQLGYMVQRLSTSAAPLVSEPTTGIIEPVVSVLLHVSLSARLAAAWCLRCIAIALPSQLTPLLDRCMNSMVKLKSSPEAVSGYSCALAALLGGVYECPLGIPHAKGKKIFSIAEDLLRNAQQNSRLSLQRTQSGWLLLGALMTLGPPVVKHHLPRMLLLWRNAFPRSAKELESEKVRGDAFTWQVTLEGRAGALGAMHGFVCYCRELVTEDVTRRLLAPLECALTMMQHMPSITKMYGSHLKASAAMVRLRLYDVLLQLPPETYEGAFKQLFRELVAEFTLTDNPSNTTTSRLRSMCHVDDSVILGSWLQETDHKAIEDQMEPNRRLDTEHLQPNSASGSGALEHDAACLYTRCAVGETIPGPLPLGVAVIDSSVRLYGLVFPRVNDKHRLQMLSHFSDCIKSAKSSRQQAVQINIFTAVLCALKGLADAKKTFGQSDVRKAAVALVLDALNSSNPILRCAAGEALGRMAQVIEDGRFIAEMAQYSFDRLKTARDVVTRTGHSLALGCLHRYVGGMGSGQHLKTSVSILLALAKDSASPIVQVWSLHALGLIADSGGPMFRGYVEPALSLVLSLLLAVPPANVDVHQCLGKCLSALITTIGPELQGNSVSIVNARMSCLVCCAIMQDHSDSLVQAEAIACLQQLHMFAPRHVNLTTLVPHLCATLASSHLLLRRAAVACLRQLSQREAREVSEHALTLARDGDGSGDEWHDKVNVTETGLEGVLFGLLDTETDEKLCKDVRDTLLGMLQSLAVSNLTHWFKLVKDVLSASTDTGSLADGGESGAELDKDDDDEDEDDTEGFKGVNEAEVSHPTVAPRWPTRVFATDCMRKIIAACVAHDEVHFDLIAAKERKMQNGKADYLVLHLNELVRVAFIAATSDSDQLRFAGLAILQDIINKFAKVPEPEFPGHVILEQFQAQVGAALRPAFSPDTPSDVTAAACEVCSTWIGSGVARDLNDLRRVHQLLVSSLAKLNTSKEKGQLYSESASTMERLAVLKAWAEVYIEAMKREKSTDVEQKAEKEANEWDDYQGSKESLLSLVKPELPSLSQYWLSVLKDQAMLSLPSEYHAQLPKEGGAFYKNDTMDASRPHYRTTWPPCMHAITLWFSEAHQDDVDSDRPANAPPANMPQEAIDPERFHLILGICVEALCSPNSTQPLDTVDMCLRAVYTLLEIPWSRARLAADPQLAIEVLNVVHRLMLTRENPQTRLLAIDVVKQVIQGALEGMEGKWSEEKAGGVEVNNRPANQGPAKEADDTEDCEKTSDSSSTADNTCGEGGLSGELVPGKSLVYATLEVCLCVLTRHFPTLNPTLPSTGFQIPPHQSKVSDEASQLMASTLHIMADLPALCSPRGSVSILPTILFLTMGVMRELSPSGTPAQFTQAVPASLQTLKSLCGHPLARDRQCSADWTHMLQSALMTILDFAKPDHSKGKHGLDDSVLLLTMAIFITSCPKEVINVKNLLYPCIDIFKELWQSKDPVVRLKAVQSICSVFQHPDQEVSTSFIHALAPPIIEWLSHVGQSRPTNETELSITMDSIKAVEILVKVAEENAKLNLLSLLVPILISCLLDNSVSWVTVNQHSRTLHEQALQKLVQIGPVYPEQFRAIMSRAPDLRARLEEAVRASQNKEKAKAAVQNKQDVQPAQPKIQLKMDFATNFS